MATVSINNIQPIATKEIEKKEETDDFAEIRDDIDE